MKLRLRKFRYRLIAPLLSVGLLGGIIAENRTYLRADDPVFEQYHQQAKAAIDSLPHMVGSLNGVDNDQAIPKEAQTLLKPNRIMYRSYIDTSVEGMPRQRKAELLIVQCRRSGDMLGHYPPICYPSSGMESLNGDGEAREWVVNPEGFTIPGMEYQYVKLEDGQSRRKTVYNFLIVPGRGIVRDMEGVKTAAEDYQQRYFGAAQFQVVFERPAGNDLTREEKDKMFTTLMQQAVPVIEQLSKGALR